MYSDECRRAQDTNPAPERVADYMYNFANLYTTNLYITGGGIIYIIYILSWYEDPHTLIARQSPVF
jgi:hypothetical protein